MLFRITWHKLPCLWDEDIEYIVEYNSVTWSSYLKQDIEAIGRAQRCFTKRLAGLNKYSYSERLAWLNLPCFELHGLQNNLVWGYKILFGYRYVVTSIMRTDDFFESRLSNAKAQRSYL